MTAQQLKNSILQMAVQGKLVPQDPNDEPASVLLERIKTEKQELIKAGKIKKDKKTSEIFRGASRNLPYAFCEQVGKEIRDIADEVPFEIHDSWGWVHLDHIAISDLGKTLDKAKNTGNSQPYLCSINVYWNGIDLSKVKEARFEDSELPKYLLKKGDLLICEGGEVGRCCVWDKDIPMYYQNALHRVRFYGNINPHYFKYLMELYKGIGIIEAHSKGVTIKHLVQKSLNSIYFPLPPLSEQNRIVSKIEELLPFIEKYAQVETQLTALNTSFPETLKKSILQEAVQGRLVPQDPNDEPASVLLERIRAEKQALVKAGKIKKDKHESVIVTRDKIPYEIPNSWVWCRLGDVLREVIVPQRDKPHFSPHGIPWCRIEDRDGFYLNGSKSNQLVSKETIEEMNLKVLPIGTVLSACTGGSIGTIVINTIECCTNQTFNGLVCSSGLYNWYLFWFLTSKFSELTKVGSGTTIAYVSQSKSKEMLIPLPPLSEQHRIVAKIEELMKLCKIL